MVLHAQEKEKMLMYGPMTQKKFQIQEGQLVGSREFFLKWSLVAMISLKAIAKILHIEPSKRFEQGNNATKQELGIILCF